MSETLGEFEQLVLFAMLRLGDDAYGAAIGAAIEENTGRHVAAGAIYVTLERLRKRGLVTSSWGEPTGERGGRRRRYYRLESEGAALLYRSYEDLQRLAAAALPELRSMVDEGGAER
jgi:DNA-binding PadR family transcriptional regulator